MSDNYIIRPMQDADLGQVAKLEARVYGPGRFARTAYRLREDGNQRSELCMTAWRNDELAGSVRLTRVQIGATCKAALLGPLNVAPEHTGDNLGIRLIEAAADAARAIKLDALILIGDAPYYGKAGFKPLPFGRVTMPGPVDPARLLVLELASDVAQKCHGMITATKSVTAPNSTLKKNPHKQSEPTQ